MLTQCYFCFMKFKIHYIDDTKGEPTAVKMDIQEWNQLKDYLLRMSQHNGEGIDFVETPVRIPKLEVQPRKKRSFSDFLMDL